MQHGWLWVTEEMPADRLLLIELHLCLAHAGTVGQGVFTMKITVTLHSDYVEAVCKGTSLQQRGHRGTGY